jgi:signal peptide peptidase SppA
VEAFALGQDRYQHVARAVFDTPWYIREAEGSVIASIVRGRLAGEGMTDAEITARVEAARAAQGPRGGQVAGPVAIIPVYGVIMPRANLMPEMSGGTTVGAIRANLEEAIRDKDIAAVIAEFDSPGGSVEGIEELASWIRENRGQKPMVAVVNTMCCSAAYYLAAQFDEIVASPSSLTGSIGVFTEHVEYSRMDDEAGITTTIVQQPDTKHDINDSQPLSDAGMAHLQMLVDDYYNQFVTAVAKGRGVAPAIVRDGYGQGRELTAGRAKTAGLADRVDTLDNTIRRLASGRGRAAMQPAALDSGLLFSERLALVSASARELAEHARERAEMRGRDGRSLSAADRDGLLATADSLRELAALGPVEEPPASTNGAWRSKARIALELVQAEFDFQLTGETIHG